MSKSAIVEMKGPFTVTLSSTQEVNTFETGWLARIENGQLVVGVEHSTYNGPFLEPRNVYALGAWAKIEHIEANRDKSQ